MTKPIPPYDELMDMIIALSTESMPLPHAIARGDMKAVAEINTRVAELVEVIGAALRRLYRERGDDI